MFKPKYRIKPSVSRHSGSILWRVQKRVFFVFWVEEDWFYNESDAEGAIEKLLARDRAIQEKEAKIKKYKPKVYGFTLIELMTVIAIISILLSVAIPAYKKAKMEKEATEAQSVTQQVSQPQQNAQNWTIQYK